MMIRWHGVAFGCVAAVIALPWPAMAQFREPPPPAAYAIQNVTIVQADGSRAEGVTIVVRDGLIEAIGPDVTVPADAKLLEGDSLLVYPGFVDGQGQAEYEFPEPAEDDDDIDSWAPPRDAQSFTPHRRVVDHLTAIGEDLSEQRKKGIVAAAVHADGRLMPGQATLLLFRKDAQIPKELVVNPVLGLSASLRGAQGVYPTQLFTVMAFYRQSFEDARRQGVIETAFQRNPRGIQPPRWDPDYAVLRDVMSGATPTYFAVDGAENIRNVLQLAEEYGFNPIIVGGDDAWKVADLLAQRNVPVLVSLDFPKPDRWKPEQKDAEALSDTTAQADTAAAEPPAQEEPLDPAAAEAPAEEEPLDPAAAEAPAQAEPLDPAAAEAPAQAEPLDPAAEREKKRIEDVYRNASKLAEAGVTFALTSGGGKADLREGARKVIEYGLSEADALTALTTTPARLLGIPTVVRVDQGMPATFLVTDGAMFADETNITYTFVEGWLEEGKVPGEEGSGEAATVNITGTWELDLDGQFTATMKVTQDEEGKVSGTFSFEFGSGTVSGSVSGNSMSLEIALQFGGEAMTVNVDGTVDGDTASGDGSSPQGDFEWTGRKTGPGGNR